jgi:hypothetical protein
VFASSTFTWNLPRLLFELLLTENQCYVFYESENLCKNKNRNLVEAASVPLRTSCLATWGIFSHHICGLKDVEKYKETGAKQTQKYANWKLKSIRLPDLQIFSDYLGMKFLSTTVKLGGCQRYWKNITSMSYAGTNGNLASRKRWLKYKFVSFIHCFTKRGLCFVLFGSATLCASPPPRPSIFSNYSFRVNHIEHKNWFTFHRK